MISRRRHVLGALLALLALGLTQSAGGSTTRPAATVPTGPPSFQTAFVDPFRFGTSTTNADFVRARDAGGTVVRLTMNWQGIAPTNPKDSFKAADPADPQYKWDGFDDEIKAAKQHGLEPIIDIYAAPRWATAQTSGGSNYKPSPKELGLFATAAAKRYSGSFHGLPRVKFWQVWNEPNVAVDLRPQYVGKKLVSPTTYRNMVNAFAASVHAVHRDNAVIAGGTAPFTQRSGKQANWGPGPLSFMRDLLCLSAKLKPTCKTPVHFDIWSHHPYTSGGALHHAAAANDVSVADLPKMKKVLDAAVKTHHVISNQPVRFWVTEFSWDTDPPDPAAMPLALQTRWVPEAFYEMWKSGVSLVTWFLLQDQPFATSPYQSGLFNVNGSPKPSWQAFRFPFVAFPEGSRILVWGRTPTSKRARVVIEQKQTSSWKRIGTATANANGIFTTTFPAAGKGYVRARIGNNTAIPFSLVEPPDRMYRPFGSGGSGVPSSSHH